MRKITQVLEMITNTSQKRGIRFCFADKFNQAQFVFLQPESVAFKFDPQVKPTINTTRQLKKCSSSCITFFLYIL
jgi:hypothetical protein